MIWRSLFSQTILIRGLDYFRRKKVVRLTQAGENYSASVLGSRLYTVHIEGKDGALASAGCDCPHCRSGYYCKHIAAVLFAIDEYEQTHETAEVKPNPFEAMYDGADEGAYRYFDMRRITRGVLVYEETYRRALKLLRDKKVTDINLLYRYGGDREPSGMVCEACGLYTGDFDCVISAVFDREGIIETNCEKYVHGFGTTGRIMHGDRFEPNQYLLALLLGAGEQLSRSPNAGDSTSSTGMKLLDSFRADRSSGSLSELRQEIRLEPHLVKEDGRYYMTLRAGTDRMYVVRDITEFVESVDGRSVMSLGRLQMNFLRDRISDREVMLFRFVRNVTGDAKFRDEGVRNRYYGAAQHSEKIRNRIELYGSRMDEFFDALNQSGISEIGFTQVQGKSKTASRLMIGCAAPEITLDLHKDIDSEGTFHGISAAGKAPEFISGSEHHYFIDGAKLCRVPSETDSQLSPVYVLLGKGQFSFSVGRNNMAEFFYSVLPKLRGIIEVREHDTEKNAEYLPPEAEIAFYLDIEEGIMTCKASARYGRAEFWLSGDTADGDGIRDIHREGEALEVVREYFPQYDEANGVFACEHSDDAAYRILSEGVGELLRVGEVNCTDRFKALNIRRRVPVKVGVSVSGDLMNLSIESDGLSVKELAEILKSYRKKKRFHRLKNGDFVDMDDTIAELSDMLDTLRLTSSELARGSVNLPVYRALYLDQMSENCGALRISRDSYFKKIIKEFKTVSESDFEVPAHLLSVMRNYQIHGHRWLRTLEKYGFGGVLADDMGLGKTLQIISVLSAAKSEGAGGVSLVVCPASLIYNWLEELSRFAPELKAIAVAGNQFERAEIIENITNYDVAVTSYDLLKRDIAQYETVHFNYEVIDEAQYIKNHSTAAAKAVKVIHSCVRFALTGTPIENRLSELWSIFDYLMPGFLYGYETFRKELEAPIAKKGDIQATEKLKRMTSPFILRRLKNDVLKDLPDKIEEVKYAAFEGEQRKLYDAQVAHMKGMLENSDQSAVSKNKIQILAELTRIRQICCDPSLVFEDYKGQSAKRSACIDLVRSAIEGEHKILLFSQFTSMLELLEGDLAAEGIACYKMTGSTPKQQRVELVQKFNGDDTPVFLISLKAGGTGLNLTGADVVIHYDPWWNVAAQNQATDRAHRIGQTRIVSVCRLIAKNSVEEKILALQETKKNLADEILSGETSGIGSMSREELLALLG